MFESMCQSIVYVYVIACPVQTVSGICVDREARERTVLCIEFGCSASRRAARQLETMKAELTQNAEREKLRGEVLAMKAAMEKAALEQRVRELERTCMLQGIAQAQHSVWRSMIPTLPQGAASHSMQGTPTTGRANVLDRLAESSPRQLLQSSNHGAQRDVVATMDSAPPAKGSAKSQLQHQPTPAQEQPQQRQTQRLEIKPPPQHALKVSPSTASTIQSACLLPENSTTHFFIRFVPWLNFLLREFVAEFFTLPLPLCYTAMLKPQAATRPMPSTLS